jgi:hypothetical protein
MEMVEGVGSVVGENDDHQGDDCEDSDGDGDGGEDDWDTEGSESGEGGGGGNESEQGGEGNLASHGPAVEASSGSDSDVAEWEDELLEAVFRVLEIHRELEEEEEPESEEGEDEDGDEDDGWVTV